MPFQILRIMIGAIVLAVIVAINNINAAILGGGGLLGGLSPANITDPDIQNVATFAVSQLGSDYAITELTSAQTQVCATLLLAFYKDISSFKVSFFLNPETTEHF